MSAVLLERDSPWLIIIAKLIDCYGEVATINELAMDIALDGNEDNYKILLYSGGNKHVPDRIEMLQTNLTNRCDSDMATENTAGD